MAEKNKKEVSFTQGPIFGSIVRFALPVLGALVRQAAFLLLSVILSQNMYHYNEIITSPFAHSGSSSASIEMLRTKVT